MTLSEAQRRCDREGCKRAPAYPDQRYCAEHRVKWEPEWVRRAREHRLPPKAFAS